VSWEKKWWEEVTGKIEGRKEREMDGEIEWETPLFAESLQKTFGKFTVTKNLTMYFLLLNFISKRLLF
jgi:hypothetical protein